MDNVEITQHQLTHRETTQDVILENLTQLLADHENRIRFLERYFNYAVGAIGIVSLVVSGYKHL